jgi:hypothetical protein
MQMEDDRYGLGISLGDYDGNGWTDLYVCNDYSHADFLYMNSGGRFTDELRERTGHISFYSMGSDAGDINNDGWEDVFVLDMAFEDHYRAKTNMESMQPELFWSLVDEGHHFPFAQNTLQLNRGDGYFSEIGQLAGVSKTDWSWAALLADLNQDGLRDLIVTNGILRDMKNNDFSQWAQQKYQGRIGPTNYLEVLSHLPSNPVPNKLYQNRGGLRFDDITEGSAFQDAGFSHGLAYADFDGDGALDLVINNMNAPASLYRNISPRRGNQLTIRLEGFGSNINGLGTPVQVFSGGTVQAGTMQTTRGYYSASVPELHFGLGNAANADSVIIYWNARAMTVLKDVKANQTLHVSFSGETKIPFRARHSNNIQLDTAQKLPFVHIEQDYDDYAAQVLLPYKLSQNGPFLSCGDVNGDGLGDIYIGGAAGQEGAVLLQSASGKFLTMPQPAFGEDKKYEDQESQLADFDGDGDLDLYVVSGSNEIPEGSELLSDRLYINDGSGTFVRAMQSIPDNLRINGQSVSAADFDGDGDVDLFIGGRLRSGQYMLPGHSVLLQNEKGVFMDISARVPGIASLGMVTDSESIDIDLDGDQDIVVVGEWMAPTILINDGDTFSIRTLSDPGIGIWWTVGSGDFDGDGDPDLILGNLGWNQKFGGRNPKLSVYAADFDQNGDHDVVLAKQVGDTELPYRGRECSSEEMPFIAAKFPSYDAFANAELRDILGSDQLDQSVHLKIKTLSSVVLRNDGNLQFTSLELPVEAQSGVVKAVWIEDLNQDGHLDFVYVGNHFPAEVETARYDGLLHGICFGDGQCGFKARILSSDQAPFTGDYRDICVVQTQNQPQLILARNNGSFMAYELSVPLR